MIIYEVPGREEIKIENIVFDYNGTLAVDGKLIAGVEELINKLADYVDIYILTADTYGTVEKECANINGIVQKFPRENAGKSKMHIVKSLGSNSTACLGNGFNDLPMFKESILSICIIEGEGASGELVLHSDIVARSIVEAIEILLNKTRLKATLRS